MNFSDELRKGITQDIDAILEKYHAIEWMPEGEYEKMLDELVTLALAMH